LFSGNKTERAAAAVREYERLSANRGILDSHCEEIAERVVPRSKGLFLGKINPINVGDKKNEEIFDSSPAIALSRMVAIIDSLLSPRNETWHRLSANDPNLAKIRSVQLYFEEANQTLFRHRYAAKANFSSQNYQTLESSCAFGTGSMFVDALYGEQGLRYRNIHLGEIYFKENHQGQVDTAIRCFPMSARQALQKWPKTLPDTIRKTLVTDPDKEFWFVHEVKPRIEGYDPTRKDFKGMFYQSLYVSLEDKAELDEGGYNVFPYPAARFNKSHREPYGRGAFMDVLPAIKTLNLQKKVLLKQGHMAVDPIYLMHDDGIMDGFAAIPGTMVPGGVSKEGRQLVQALQPGNVSLGKDLMDLEKQAIDDASFVSLFQILIENPQMSATEVLERSKEKGILLAPPLGILQTEYHGALIERELDLLSMQGLLPEMPPELVEAGGGFRVDYESPLNRSQRSGESSGVMRTIESMLAVVNVTQNPEPLDFFNWDVIAKETAFNQGVPTRYMRSDEEVQAIRQGRAQQAEDEKAIQAAPAAAAMVKAANNA